MVRDLGRPPPGTDVTRVEIEFGRKALTEFRLDSPTQVLSATSGLWAYGTEQWLTHRIPTPDCNRSRWPVSPIRRCPSSSTATVISFPEARIVSTTSSTSWRRQACSQCHSSRESVPKTPTPRNSMRQDHRFLSLTVSLRILRARIAHAGGPHDAGKSENTASPGEISWAQRDSNPRPQPCEGCALTS